MTTTATPTTLRPIADGNLDAVARHSGWTATPLGYVGTLYTRGAETLRVLYSTANPARRAITAYEHERPAGSGLPPHLVHGDSHTSGKRSRCIGILSAEPAPAAPAPAASPAPAPVACGNPQCTRRVLAVQTNEVGQSFYFHTTTSSQYCVTDVHGA